MEKISLDMFQTIVPQLAQAMGGSLRPLVINKISMVLLQKSDASEDEIALAMQRADIEKLTQLKKLETDFVLEMRDLDVDFVKAENADRSDARKYNFGKQDLTPKIIGITAVTFFFGYVAAITFYPFKTPLNMELVNLVMGYVSGIATTVVAFYYGSSAGSEAKTRMIADKKEQ